TLGSKFAGQSLDFLFQALPIPISLGELRFELSAQFLIDLSPHRILCTLNLHFEFLDLHLKLLAFGFPLNLSLLTLVFPLLRSLPAVRLWERGYFPILPESGRRLGFFFLIGWPALFSQVFDFPI